MQIIGFLMRWIVCFKGLRPGSGINRSVQPNKKARVWKSGDLKEKGLHFLSCRNKCLNFRKYAKSRISQVKVLLQVNPIFQTALSPMLFKIR